MKTKAPAKIIKKRDRALLKARSTVKSGIAPNGWSKSVRAWVVEFQNRDRDESLPAFDSLFKEAQPGNHDQDLS